MIQFEKDIKIYKNRAVITSPYIIFENHQAILYFEKQTIYDKQAIKALNVQNSTIADKMLKEIL